VEELDARASSRSEVVLSFLGAPVVLVEVIGVVG
jgi:hypothetical protein